MFRLIRFVILCMLAFVAGVFYERKNTADACKAVGGEMVAGLCIAQGGS